jgi:hypothetical protein
MVEGLELEGGLGIEEVGWWKDRGWRDGGGTGVGGRKRYRRIKRVEGQGLEGGRGVNG